MSLRTLAIALTGICVTLGLLSISTLTSALLSTLIFFAIVIAAACLGIARQPPTNKFWRILFVVPLLVAWLAYSDHAGNAVLKQVFTRQISQPLYQSMHSEQPEKLPPFYLYGSQIRRSVVDDAGDYQGWAGVTPREVKSRSIDTRTLPTVARHEEFYQILTQAIALFVGWIAAALTCRISSP